MISFLPRPSIAGAPPWLACRRARCRRRRRHRERPYRRPGSGALPLGFTPSQPHDGHARAGKCLSPDLAHPRPSTPFHDLPSRWPRSSRRCGYARRPQAQALRASALSACGWTTSSRSPAPSDREMAISSVAPRILRSDYHAAISRASACASEGPPHRHLIATRPPPPARQNLSPSHRPLAGSHAACIRGRAECRVAHHQ